DESSAVCSSDLYSRALRDARTPDEESERCRQSPHRLPTPFALLVPRTNIPQGHRVTNLLPSRVGFTELPGQATHRAQTTNEQRGCGTGSGNPCRTRGRDNFRISGRHGRCGTGRREPAPGSPLGPHRFAATLSDSASDLPSDPPAGRNWSVPCPSWRSALYKPHITITITTENGSPMMMVAF